MDREMKFGLLLLVLAAACLAVLFPILPRILDFLIVLTNAPVVAITFAALVFYDFCKQLREIRDPFWEVRKLQQVQQRHIDRATELGRLAKLKLDELEGVSQR